MMATLDMTPEGREGWTSFQLRRMRIVEDCRQIQLDIQAWNEMNPDEKPIEMEFDFVKDLEEDEQS